MRLHLLVLSMACSALACGCEPLPYGSRTPVETTIRVATWNVHDLFDAEDRLTPPGDLDEVPTSAEVEAKLDAVAAVLVRVGADLVLLQELENLPLAEALASRAGYAGAWLVDGFDPRGIDVAVLSRSPLDRYVSHLGEVGSDGRPLWSRDCVEAWVGTAGRPLVIVGSHLVSRVTDPAGDRRRGQAARMREIADAAAGAGAIVVAGGDLNDAPGSDALAPLLADGAWLDALALVGLEATWTWGSATEGARFDYLLLRAEEAWRLSSAGVVEGADVEAASDHRPVVVDLAWGR